MPLLLSLPLYQTINMSTLILCLCNFSPSLLLFLCQEKRRLQEEQDRARREMEDEKLRLQQLKVWHTHTGWSNLSHSFTHILTHTRSLNFTHLKSSADPFQLVSKQMDSKFISFSHTYSHIHTQLNCATFHTSWFCQFLTRLDASLPLLKSVFMWVFTHSAKHRAALLFSHHFQPGVPTSYSTVLHCPGAHSLNCVKFVQRVFVRTQVCVWSCKRRFCICSPYLCVRVSLCTTH